MTEMTTKERIAFEIAIAKEQYIDPRTQQAERIAGTFAAGADAVREQVQSGRVNPAKGRGQRAPRIAGSQGASDDIGLLYEGMSQRARTPDFGGKTFGMNDARLEFSSPFNRRKAGR